MNKTSFKVKLQQYRSGNSKRETPYLNDIIESSNMSNECTTTVIYMYWIGFVNWLEWFFFIKHLYDIPKVQKSLYRSPYFDDQTFEYNCFETLSIAQNEIRIFIVEDLIVSLIINWNSFRPLFKKKEVKIILTIISETKKYFFFFQNLISTN